MMVPVQLVLGLLVQELVQLVEVYLQVVQMWSVVLELLELVDRPVRLLARQVEWVLPGELAYQQAMTVHPRFPLQDLLVLASGCAGIGGG
jgi:hypothetical protein